MKKSSILLLLFYITLSHAVYQQQTILELTKYETNDHLSETVFPTFYDLSLTIDPEKDTFNGKVNITFDVAENISVGDISIIIDGDSIIIQTVTLNKNISCTSGAPNEADIVLVSCSKNATGKNNYLYIEYTGKLSTDGYGVVKSTYLDQEQQQTLVESIFEPIYARRIFPCFDEPVLGAKFSIEIVYLRINTLTSNTYRNEVTTVRALLNPTTSEMTPEVLTYLVSFMIPELPEQPQQQTILEQTTNETNYRLPETVSPKFYELSLTIDPENDTFSGNVNIRFDVAENISVSDISVNVDGDYIVIETVTLNKNINCTTGTSDETHILLVSCPENATGKDNYLYLSYTGNFSTDGYGLVKSTYTDQGKQQVLVQSVFKPIYARRVFPCFDEPELKAAFSIEITHPSDYTAISNTQGDGGEDTGIRADLSTTKFNITKEIPTYTVSFIISKLQEVKMVDEDYDFKIFARNDVANSLSAVVGKYYTKIIDQINKYMEITYDSLGTTECYQVVVPEYSDTAGGFGMFVYRETDLLDDGDKTTNIAIQKIIKNLAYNLIHEWYGGDLTVKRWSDSWANEAVALYLSNIIADEVITNLDLSNQFVIEDVHSALRTDAYPSALPLSSSETSIELSTDISLDTSNYQKGASVLRMINSCIQKERSMQSSLVYHWTKRNGLNTDGLDLVEDLTKNMTDFLKGASLFSYFNTWLTSPGYPLLTAKVVNVTGSGVEVVRLFQKRFVYPTNDTKVDDEVKWTIPLSSSSGQKDEFSIRVELYWGLEDGIYYFGSKDNYLLFNVQRGFFYRVNYDEVLWKRVIKYMKIEEKRAVMDSLTRAQLVDDIFNIARTGDVSYSLAFQLVEYLDNETDYYPWYSAFSVFSYLLGKLGDDKAEEGLKTFILGLMNHIIQNVNEIAPDSENHVDLLKRVMILKWASDLNHKRTVSSLLEKFKNFQEKQSSIEDYNLRQVIFCTGIRHSENVTEDWNFLWNVYSTSSSVHEQGDILNALGCTKNEDILKSYLSKIITPDSGIKKEDSLTIFKSVFSSFNGLPVDLSFLKKFMKEVMSQELNTWPEILYEIAEKLHTDESYAWFTDMLSNEIFDGHEDVVSKAKTITSVNNYWANNFQVYVKEILLNLPTTTATNPTTEKSISSASTEDTTELTESTSIIATTEGSATTGRLSIITAASLILLILVLT